MLQQRKALKSFDGINVCIFLCGHQSWFRKTYNNVFFLSACMCICFNVHITFCISGVMSYMWLQYSMCLFILMGFLCICINQFKSRALCQFTQG